MQVRKNTPLDTMEADEIAAIRERLAQLDAERAELEARLVSLWAAREVAKKTVPDSSNRLASPIADAPVTNASPPAAKIALIRSLFRGREDVFPRRWESAKTGKAGYAPACSNEWVRGVCGKPKIKCAVCPNRAFLPITDSLIDGHLRGRHTVGVYPMLADESCWFLATDFDKTTWREDAVAYLAACRVRGVPAALERSRSGNGGHVWTFFAEPVPASLARRLGAHLITEAMEQKPDIGFSSYDRFFPSQDTMPAGGFGNLIALPLQYGPRRAGNSLFIDGNFEPYGDQWAFLSTLPRMTLMEVTAIAEEAGRQGRILGLRLPLDEVDEEPWAAPPSRHRPEAPIAGPLPEHIEAVLADQIYIPRAGLPAGLVNRFVRLAAFQNPEFYGAQAMRLPTFGIPRVIACAELLSHHIALPRGCREPVEELLSNLNISLHWRDERNGGRGIEAIFLGELTDEQQTAAQALLRHDTGVLAATTAFGKTIVAAAMIAERRVNTLVLVHRRQLMEQWAARLANFLDLPPGTIGQIGGGRRRPTGIVDIAMIQSLAREREASDIVANYGHLVVDECHHLSAVSFEAVVRRAKAKYLLGLSATVTRKDGHHPIIFMQCGPARYRVDARAKASAHPFGHRVIPRTTSFTLPSALVEGPRPPIQQVYAALAVDEVRNDLIFDDVLKALEGKRSPVILTERKDHALILSERLSRFARNVILLTGGMGVRQRQAVMQRLADIPPKEERVLIATGRYIGEGFDDARLDTLFLAMPISWKGTLAQYVGRLHRLHPDKKEVVVYDYIDKAVPVLARMSEKRIKGYRSLGYSLGVEEETPVLGLG
ncbi:MAG: DEAD/DEAH box helicase family protein [Parvibaculaceae bacterium]